MGKNFMDREVETEIKAEIQQKVYFARLSTKVDEKLSSFSCSYPAQHIFLFLLIVRMWIRE